MSMYLWSGWKWQRGVKEITSALPCCPVNCDNSWKEIQIEKSASFKNIGNFNDPRYTGITWKIANKKANIAICQTARFSLSPLMELGHFKSWKLQGRCNLHNTDYNQSRFSLVFNQNHSVKYCNVTCYIEFYKTTISYNFLWNLGNFSNLLFYRTPLRNCFGICE